MRLLSLIPAGFFRLAEETRQAYGRFFIASSGPVETALSECLAGRGAAERFQGKTCGISENEVTGGLHEP